MFFVTRENTHTHTHTHTHSKKRPTSSGHHVGCWRRRRSRAPAQRLRLDSRRRPLARRQLAVCRKLCGVDDEQLHRTYRCFFFTKTANRQPPTANQRLFFYVYFARVCFFWHSTRTAHTHTHTQHAHNTHTTHTHTHTHTTRTLNTPSTHTHPQHTHTYTQTHTHTHTHTYARKI